LTGYAEPTRHSSPIGRYVMATAEHREPCDSRGSCTVLGAPGGGIPPGDSTFATKAIEALRPWMSASPQKRTISRPTRHVRLVPKADSCTAAKMRAIRSPRRRVRVDCQRY
jgi:hypothetical protein